MGLGSSVHKQEILLHSLNSGDLVIHQPSKAVPPTALRVVAWLMAAATVFSGRF